jgi:hypothetical protein
MTDYWKCFYFEMAPGSALRFAETEVLKSGEAIAPYLGVAGILPAEQGIPELT